MWARCCLALAAGGLLIVSASATQARASDNGGIGVRIVDVPVSNQDDPRARLYIVDHLAPGTTIHRRIEVSNTTGETVNVVVYAAAAHISGGSFLFATGDTPNDLSTWIGTRPASTVVPSASVTDVSVTISVPGDAAPGEQYAVVWAEVRSAPPSALGVSQVSRVGIRVYLSVGPGGPPAANFAITSMAASRSTTGAPQIRAVVRNTGGRALDLSGQLRLLAGPGGLSAGPFPVQLGTTLAVGDAEPVIVILDKQVPPGPWNAHLQLKSGLVERSAEATLTFPASGSGPAVQIPSKTKAFPFQSVLVLLGVLATAGATATGIRRHRRQRTPRAPQRMARL